MKTFNSNTFVFHHSHSLWWWWCPQLGMFVIKRLILYSTKVDHKLSLLQVIRPLLQPRNTSVLDKFIFRTLLKTYFITSNQILQIWSQSGSDWPQIGHIWDFFRSDFSVFWCRAPRCTEIWSEKIPYLLHFWPIWLTLEPHVATLLESFVCDSVRLFLHIFYCITQITDQ